MSIWPLPRTQSSGNSIVWFSKDAELCIQDLHADQTSETSLRAAFERLKQALFCCNITPHKFHPGSEDFEPDASNRLPIISQIVLEQVDLGQVTDDASPEAYELFISADGSVRINFCTYAGALHGFNTMLQLFYSHSSGNEYVYTACAPISVKDRPSFEHRGLSLDIARNRISPKAVKRVLEAMSMSKINRLHLHAWDSQSWPIEIPSLPDLALKGAYHSSQIWTPNDLEHVQQYGVERGVEVYFDADMPGHTASIHHAYPELITGYNIQPWEPWCLEPPSGQLKLNSTQVYEFLNQLFDDLLPRIARYSSHLQVGGEEINTKIYELDETVKSSSKAVLRPLLQKFMDHVISHSQKHSLTPIAWEEALLEWNLKLPKDTIIQAWKSEESLSKIVARGYRALAGTHTHWYLDGGHGGWLDPDPSNPNTPIKPPYLDWNAPQKNWRQILSYDPLKDIPEEHKHLVLGGEVLLWSELADEANLDVLLWPRVFAAAEVLWRGKGYVCEDSTRRLAQLRERLVAKGYGAGMVQMEWCLQNPGNAQL